MKKSISHFNSKPLYLLGLMFCITLLMCNFASAGIDKSFTKDNSKVSEKTNYGTIKLVESKWYDIFGWTDDKVKDITLKSNTESCSNNCEEIHEQVLYKDGILIEDSRYWRIYEDGSRKLGNIRSEKFFIQDGTEISVEPIMEWTCEDTGKINKNGTKEQSCENKRVGLKQVETPIWKEYEIGTSVKAGNYTIKHIGEKRADWTYDWEFKTNGVWTSEWAVWGAILENIRTITTTNTGGHTGTTAKTGAKITWATNGKYVIGFSKNPSVTATKGYILNASLSVLATTDFVGNDANFSSAYAMTNGVTYYLAVDNAGSGYTDRYASSGITTALTDFTVIDTLNNVGLDDGGTSNMYSVQKVYVGSSAITLNSPADTYSSNNPIVDFNCSANVVGATLSNISLYTNKTGSWTIANTTTSNGAIMTSSFTDGSWLWSCGACDSDGDCGFASTNRTLTIDSTAPTINILSPNGTLNYGYVGQNISLNYSISDANLDSCWYEYNGTNTTTSCVLNNTFILTSQKNLTLWANDTSGNINYSVASWDYNVFENSQSYNDETISGNYEIFRLNTTILSGLNINSANLIYNGTSYSALIHSSGQERNFEASLETPILMTDQNLSFYWNLVGSSFSVNTSERIQLVRPVLLDNCSTYTFKILNISLYDEELKTPLTGNIEFNYQLLNSYSFSELDTVNLSVSGVQSLGVCSNINISNLDIFYSAEIKYYSDGYAPELYHIQRAELIGDAVSINLYDLNQTDSTEFKITYQDDSYIYVEGAIVQLMRKYISENAYEIVEAPLTSNEGAAVVHIDLSTNKYQATIIKDGVVLDFFDNLVFKCDSILTGDCTQKLLGSINPSNEVNVDNLLDFAYSEPVISGNTITVFFSIPSNTASEVNMVMTQKDPFSNATICNQTITSSAGSIQCDIEETLGDSYLDLQIIKNDNLVVSSSYIIPADDDLDFLGNNFFILFIIVLSLIMMALSSPEWIIVEGVITIIIGGALFLIKGVSFVIGFGAVMWLIIAAGILIFKLARQEDR